MKKILLLVGLIGAGAAFGQDYYSPTDKDKEPLARFPIDLKISGQTMKYTLPVELIGVENTDIILTQQSDKDGIRTFTSPHAKATCMGSSENPGCVVVHSNLSVNKEASEFAINNRFADPALRASATAIALDFQKKLELDSGNEPIGFIGAVKNRSIQWPVDVSKKPSSPGGIWVGYYQGANASTAMKIDFGKSQFYVLKSAQANPQDPNSWVAFGKLNIRWTPFHAAGEWYAQGRSGWFDFTFNAEINQFEGTYATFTIDANGSKNYPSREGRWIGARN